MPIIGIVASSITNGLSSDAGSMFPIGSVIVPSGGSASITFASIPQTYKHLQLRLLTSSPNGATEGYIEYNADYTATNYYSHRMFSNGGATGSGSFNTAYIFNGWQTGLANSFVATIVDILDYTNTNKRKTTRALTGFETNTGASNSSWIAQHQSMWNNTNAITQIRITMSPGYSFNQYSTAALYGIL